MGYSRSRVWHPALVRNCYSCLLRVDGANLQDRIEKHRDRYDRLLCARVQIFSKKLTWDPGTTSTAMKSEKEIDEFDEDDGHDERTGRPWMEALMERFLILLTVASLVTFFIMIVF